MKETHSPKAPRTRRRECGWRIVLTWQDEFIIFYCDLLFGEDIQDGGFVEVTQRGAKGFEGEHSIVVTQNFQSYLSRVASKSFVVHSETLFHQLPVAHDHALVFTVHTVKMGPYLSAMFPKVTCSETLESAFLAPPLLWMPLLDKNNDEKAKREKNNIAMVNMSAGWERRFWKSMVTRRQPRSHLQVRGAFGERVSFIEAPSTSASSSSWRVLVPRFYDGGRQAQ
ncbi:hypothetical protein PIB30_097443 [Stylosanthes scabra]|uniref:Uncharacterized protein n=1 Tax=Stylosanthes scabra TaxID=79078 RepID=A0ABU6TVZ6_9FABA|nr:hypothetical protein [Stylosanthes scabra]